MKAFGGATVNLSPSQYGRLAMAISGRFAKNAALFAKEHLEPGPGPGLSVLKKQTIQPAKKIVPMPETIMGIFLHHKRVNSSRLRRLSYANQVLRAGASERHDGLTVKKRRRDGLARPRRPAAAFACFRNAAASAALSRSAIKVTPNGFFYCSRTSRPHPPADPH